MIWRKHLGPEAKRTIRKSATLGRVVMSAERPTGIRGSSCVVWTVAGLAVLGLSNVGSSQEQTPPVVTDPPVIVNPATAQSPKLETTQSDSEAKTTRGRTASGDQTRSGGEAEKRASKFLRLTERPSGPESLDVAVVRYESPSEKGVQVDLIGAIHIGERDYYQRLNDLFDQYDVLLYELVAPEGTVVPRGGKRDAGFNPVSMLQDTAKDLLGLQSQLELIDYTKPHFVRADMTPKQMSEKMAERGDTALTLTLSTLADAMRQQNLASQGLAEDDPQVKALMEMGELSLYEMMSNPLKLKQILALQFAATGSLEQTLGGRLNQLLVTDRNEVALKYLQKEIAAGKKKIGVFYGAAHLADFEEHLIEDFGLKKTNVDWIPAWDLTKSKIAPRSENASLLMMLLKALE